MRHIVLVDFSNVAHMAHAAACKAPPQYDLMDTVVVNFEGKMRTIIRSLGKLGTSEYDLIYVEDRIPARKLELLPTYRGDRGTPNDAWKAELKASLIVNGAKGRFCFSEDNEADDALATLARLATGAENVVIIVTMDKDLHQLIDDNVGVFNPSTLRMITLEDVQKSFSCEPKHIPVVKALWGDSCDCVPNAVPRAQKQLLPLIKISDGTLLHFSQLVLEQFDALSPRCQQLLAKGTEQISINFQLVKLDDHCALTWE